METVAETRYQGEASDGMPATAVARRAGLAAVGGAIVMLAGAALYFSAGADLWAAVDGGDMAGYLLAAGAAKAQLVANLILWIAGVLILGMAWNALVRVGNPRPGLAQMAKVSAAAGVPVAIVSILVMMAVVVRIAPDTSATSVALANVVGWIGIRADDLATALLIGAAPLFLSVAARGDWLPSWLAGWGYLAGFVGLFSLAVLFIPSLAGMGFLIVPVGMGWMLATGIVLLRRA